MFENGSTMEKDRCLERGRSNGRVAQVFQAGSSYLLEASSRKALHARQSLVLCIRIYAGGSSVTGEGYRQYG
ncbi:hypothetical protein ACFLUG_02895 [Chloroflexota bacterium]